MNIFRQIIFRATIVVASLLIMPNALSQSYSSIHSSLSGMTRAQKYRALRLFQKTNPYKSNVYAQLLNVSIDYMENCDPLRGNNELNSWGKNCELYLSVLKSYYKKGDAKDDTYDNLGILHSGRRITDEEFEAWMSSRKDYCQRFVSTSNEIFASISKSKAAYNSCIDKYKYLCDNYVNMSDLLLRYDKELDARLTDIRSTMEECVAAFENYKRLTTFNPIKDYRQNYTIRSIETFRLDGLTNSDFYQNSFTIWDFKGWVDAYYNELKHDIEPLRADIQKINDAYMEGRREYETAAPQNVVLKIPNDSYFFFRLGRYDNASVVRELFAYLEQTRHLLILAGDSLALNLENQPGLVYRKMRRLNRMKNMVDKVAQQRQILEESITPEKINNFAQFFADAYKGEEGLRKFIAADKDYCEKLVDNVADHLYSYINVRTTGVDGAMSEKGASGQSPLPLWTVDDEAASKAKYQTTILAYGSDGKLSHVAGRQRGAGWFVGGISRQNQTEWLKTLTGISEIVELKPLADGSCLVQAKKGDAAQIVLISPKGNIDKTINLQSNECAFMGYDAALSNIIYAEGNTLAVVNLSGDQPSWTQNISGLSEIADVQAVANGFLIIGRSQSGHLSSVKVSTNGEVSAPYDTGLAVLNIVHSSRPSETEIGLLITIAGGKHKYVELSNAGKVL